MGTMRGPSSARMIRWASGSPRQSASTVNNLAACVHRHHLPEATAAGPRSPNERRMCLQGYSGCDSPSLQGGINIFEVQRTDRGDVRLDDGRNVRELVQVRS